MKPRRGNNPKRKLARVDFWTEEERAERALRVKYGGNPEHKLNPREYGLSFVNPRPRKTLCDAEEPFSKSKAEKLLREGILKGMVREQTSDEWPQNVWAVSGAGEVYEAQLENPITGIYHGYPMQEDDDFRDVVLREWARR